jgi:hypothetical protein
LGNADGQCDGASENDNEDADAAEPAVEEDVLEMCAEAGSSWKGKLRRRMGGGFVVAPEKKMGIFTVRVIVIFNRAVRKADEAVCPPTW